MGVFNSYKNSGKYERFDDKKLPSQNPLEEYDFLGLVDSVYAAQDALDEKVHRFLGKVNNDPRIVGNFNLNEEWRCWLERDEESSRLLFDAELKELDPEAHECFKERYAAELAELLASRDDIDKSTRPLDEYKLFKTSLFNVFNNENDLPLLLYFDQVFARAADYGMTIQRHSKDDMDLLVSFNPLGKINRGDYFLSYDLYLRFNQNYQKECHMFSVCMMDAVSSDVLYSGAVNLPIYNAYPKFSKDTDSYFLNDQSSVFYQQSLKASRIKEKEKYGIPADYFEGTFIDPAKLVDFSEKSYQYGNSKIFIPKSQIAFAGDKVYMKRWLYAKLKRPVEQFEASFRNKEAVPSLDEKVATAAAVASACGSLGDKPGHNRDSVGR